MPKPIKNDYSMRLCSFVIVSVNKYTYMSQHVDDNEVPEVRIVGKLSPGKHVRVMYTPLTPILYSENRVFLFFLFLIQNRDCGYSLEPPRRSGSNVYPQSMF